MHKDIALGPVLLIRRKTVALKFIHRLQQFIQHRSRHLIARQPGLQAAQLSPGLFNAGGIMIAEGQIERSEEHTSELQSRENLVCRLLLEKKKKKITNRYQ